MKIEIEVNGINYKINLESDGNDHENGTEFIIYGEDEDENGDLITIEALQQINHPDVCEDDIIISSNIQTSKESIAEQINKLLSL